jgi:hypothetical protein
MRKTWIVAAVAALAAALGAPAAANAACTPKTNLEAIIDDSGSMTFSDPDDLRIRAMELLIDTQGNEKRTLGAVEFGTDAAPLFGPGLIGQNAAAFKTAMSTALIEDGGGTDYNKAFAAAAAHNANATGRIFLTDGAHTALDPYANGHQGGPPTYVLGLGTGGSGSPFDTLLNQIATDTGGLYRRADDASALQAAMFDLNSAIACQTPPKRFSDAFTIGKFRVIRRGKVVARSAKVRKLKVSRRRGSTFTTVRVSGLVSGKLVFSVRATKISTPGAQVSLTTQVTRRAK